MYFLLYLISIPIYLILVLASMLRAIIPTAIAVGIGFLYAFWFWGADACERTPQEHVKFYNEVREIQSMKRVPPLMVELRSQGYRFNTLISYKIETRHEVETILEYMKRKGMFCPTLTTLQIVGKRPNYLVECNDATIVHKFNTTE